MTILYSINSHTTINTNKHNWPAFLTASCLITIVALFSRDDIFMNFMKKVENIIVNSYVSVALLQCYILAS